MTTAVQLAQSVAPGVSLGFKNRIINGAMTIDQRNAGASVAIASADQYGSCDRWCSSVFNGGGRFTVQQASTAPAGFINSYSVTVTTADASPSSTYGYSIRQLIEGLNVADLGWGAAGASSVTLSFWVRSSVTGTFPLIIYNGAADRVYGATYTISSANTFEQKTITIAGDTTGTWLKTNSIGMQVSFGLGGGSSRTWSAGWQAGSGTNPTNVTGCTNLMATNGATFYITGVQLEVGTTATPFEFRDYGRELMMCQRYFVAMGGTTYERFAFGGWWANSTTGFPVCPLPVAIRNPSSVSISYNSLSYFTNNSPGGAPTSITLDWMGKNTLLSLNVQVLSGATVQAPLLLYDNGGGSARFYVSCEL